MSTAQHVPHQAVHAPLSILRTETVLSRFPIHTLTKRGRVAIRIRRANALGDIELRWDVSYNEHYGPPRQLAYKLDTIVINQRLDALPRPLPRMLNVGGLRQMCTCLDLYDSGRQHAELKSAFHQNASAYIVAYLHYRGRDGIERTVNTGFTRYSVIFTGERLPDGTIADAVYLVLSEPYLDILNHAPVRPLDYAYLKALTPMAQRFYELLSYKIFAALKHARPTPPSGTRSIACSPRSSGTRIPSRSRSRCIRSTGRICSPATWRRSSMKRPRTTTASPTGCCTTRLAPKPAPSMPPFMHQPGAEAAAALAPPTDTDQEGLAGTVTRRARCDTAPSAGGEHSPAADRPARAPVGGDARLPSQRHRATRPARQRRSRRCRRPMPTPW